MGHLTDETPKPLLAVEGESLIAHKLDVLPPEVNEIVLIVGYLEEKIRAAFGDSYKGVPIRYVEQNTPEGTAAAVWKAKDALRGPFLVMNGDDIYAKEDLAALAACPEWGMLVCWREETSHVARVLVDDSGITGILESGTHDGKPGYVNAGAYRLDERFFNYPPRPAREGSTEMGLPQTIVSAAGDIHIERVVATRWCPVNVPEDLDHAAEILGSVHILASGQNAGIPSETQAGGRGVSGYGEAEA